MKSNNDAVDKQDAHTLTHTHTEAIKEKHKAQIAKKTTTTKKKRRKETTRQRQQAKKTTSQ